MSGVNSEVPREAAISLLPRRDDRLRECLDPPRGERRTHAARVVHETLCVCRLVSAGSGASQVVSGDSVSD